MNPLRNAIADALATFQSLAEFEESMERAADLVRRCMTCGNKLLVCGNGGSAADGADFSGEFACRFVNDRRPFPSINLAADGCLTSAIGNDYSFDEIFARQVLAFAQKGDVLVVFSTSGKSRNIVRALEAAKGRGIESIAFLGKDGGGAKGLASVEFIVQSQVTARIQEAQKFLAHVLCETVEPSLAS
jgi:phosphoheptose isomerase